MATAEIFGVYLVVTVLGLLAFIDEIVDAMVSVGDSEFEDSFD